MSAYAVLRRLGDGEVADVAELGDQPLWEELGVVDADTPQQAIKAATADVAVEAKSGTFVAIPARSWKPLERTVALEEKDSWS